MTGGQTINFGYDSDDLLTSAGAMTITRDPATGFVTGTTLGAISESRTYDAFGAEQTYVVTANGTTLYSVNYGTRDALGRIVNKTETIQGVTHTYGYTYDANGRLTDVTKDGVATSHYAYDANGNRTMGPGLVASPVYDNQDRLLSYGNCTYAYKADGSLQSKTCAGATTTYDYDAFANLRGVTLPNGTAITYLIDGQNRRIGKKVNGTLMESFVYEDQLKRVGWYDGTGALKGQFIFARGRQAPDIMVRGGTAYRLTYDQVGSVREVLAPDGSVVERIDYDEFGNVLGDSAPGFQPFGFAGGLRDPDTGLTRFGARDYDSTAGRWTTADALRFGGGGANLYVYVNNDPINGTDTTGYFKVEGCSNAPASDDVAAALIASGITSKDTQLFACILRQIYSPNTIVVCNLQVDIECVGLNSANPNTGGFADIGCPENPTREVRWCQFKKFKGKCGAQALLHELAHTCGWDHGGGKGVPGDSGVLSCD